MSVLAVEGPFRPTTLVLDEQLSFERWLEIGEVLAGIHRATPWWIGSWWLEGERRYGERASAAEMFGVRPETLSTYASVCKAIPEKSRRIDVSFSTHALVANLPARERARWLKRAAEENLSGSDVRELLRGSGAVEPGPQWSNGAATVSPREALEEIRKREPAFAAIVTPALAALDLNPPAYRCGACGFEWA